MKGTYGHSLDVFFLVLLRHRQVFPARFQFVMLEFAENLEIGGKLETQVSLVDVVVPGDVRGIKNDVEIAFWFSTGCLVVPDPDERVVVFGIDRFNILDCQLFAKHLLIERHRETTVDKLAVIQRLKHKHTSVN